MSTQLTPVAQTALQKISESAGISAAEVGSVLRNMIISAKNQNGAVATDAEMVVASSLCAKYDLNPMVKECAAFVSNGKLQFVIMVDGWYKMVNRQPDFDGVEFEDKFDEKGVIFSSTCKMFLKSRSRPIVVTEYLAECKQSSTPWQKWPARMLRHKAYIQAARMAFGFSDAIDDDEARRYPEYSRAAFHGQEYTQECDTTPAPTPLDSSRFDVLMASCSTLGELDDECAGIRKELSACDWAQHKTALSEMKVAHVARINAMTPPVFEDEPILFDEDTGEVFDAE
jgi:hypothetical protein